ncbi:hypothetical protein [Candidatus Enterovibrio escicola]|uniref:hypothetical protein n=1 Tax=Candidatus Enterovibrio escicola TaxID=1927127 RepID=UPI001237AE8D|nr:hypothetical protein [Candidatus Enterovibrio escacola]
MTKEKPPKKLEGAAEFQQLNVLWRNGEILPLNAFPDEEKILMLYQIAPELSIRDHNKKGY